MFFWIFVKSVMMAMAIGANSVKRWAAGGWKVWRMNRNSCAIEL